MFPALKSIDVSGCEIKDSDLQAIASIRLQIEELVIGRDPDFVDEVVKSHITEEVDSLLLLHRRLAI